MKFPIVNIVTLEYRIPKHNDLYIDKNNKLTRYKGTNYSKRAQKRWVVEEYVEYKTFGESKKQENKRHV